MAGDKERVLESGFNSYLTKPLDFAAATRRNVANNLRGEFASYIANLGRLHTSQWR